MKIAVIVGSVRQGRVGDQVGKWVLDQASNRTDAEFTLLDLADFNLPLLTDPIVPGAAKKQYADPATTEWSKAIDGFDGYVFVTPEYNHGVPGAFKNAFDLLGSEWSNKAVGFVAYGADGGVRAVEAWRLVTNNLKLYPARNQVALRRFEEFGADMAMFTPIERRAGELKTVLDELVPLAGAIATLR